ncbi:MAG TPA: TIGR03617 family F420-dependent LLM class oxidoreductase [Acidimicrobiales bacterium]|nr:TIGR03617 family F420-dependent LLM class oxidoreductase [Acidimicrobiales bacterium]
MLVDARLPKGISDTRARAAAREVDGYDGLWVSETGYDPFLQALQAIEATSRATVGTAIAVAFARSPLTVAHSAYDLARYAEGRFVLGLGTQVKPHVERRFGMPWSSPAARMREYVLALRAIWGAWEGGTGLTFEGEFYKHSLMTPAFSPEPHPHGAPQVYLAGVGERMTEISGQVAEGFFIHPFTSRAYFDSVTRPALLRGRKAVGHDDLYDFTIAGATFVVTGRDESELARAVQGTKEQIAFYASTPSYRGVLELHGRGDLGPELTRRTKQGGWHDLAGLIDDEFLGEVAVVGEPESVGADVAARWGGVYDRLSLYTNYLIDHDVALQVVAGIRAAS